MPTRAETGDASLGAVGLASANAAGRSGNTGGQVCAISAEGEEVLMSIASNKLLSGDSDLQNDLFLKHLATGAVSRVNTGATGAPIVNRLTCHGMSQDGARVVFTSDSGGSGQVYVAGLNLSTLHVPNRRVDVGIEPTHDLSDVRRRSIEKRLVDPAASEDADCQVV